MVPGIDLSGVPDSLLDEGQTAVSEEYHAHPALGQSSLKAFVSDPVLWASEHIFGDSPPRQASKSQQWGLDFESLVFFNDLPDVVKIPDEVLDARGHRRGKAFDDWSAQHEGKRLLKAAEYLSAFEPHLRARENLRRHAKARALIWGSNAIQQGFCWRDEKHDLLWKAQVDAVHDSVLCDLKTSHDPRPESWQRDVQTYGYHWQAYHYRRGWERITGERLRFFFVVVRNRPPYDVSVVELDETWYECAAEEMSRAAAAYMHCASTGNWPTAWCAAPISMPYLPGYTRDHWHRALASLEEITQYTEISHDKR